MVLFAGCPEAVGPGGFAMGSEEDASKADDGALGNPAFGLVFCACPCGLLICGWKRRAAA